MAGIEQIDMGNSVSVTENDDCRIAVFRNETGGGMISSYEMMDGVYLLLSDFHMKNMVDEMRHTEREVYLSTISVPASQ